MSSGKRESIQRIHTPIKKQTSCFTQAIGSDTGQVLYRSVGERGELSHHRLPAAI